MSAHTVSDRISLGRLSVQECEGLLRRTPIGRIGFTFGGVQHILPVNYRYVDGTVVFRTATGRKLEAIRSEEAIAFEVDRWERETRTGWSVLVVGRPNEVVDDEIIAGFEGLGLRPWAAAPDQNRWVRISPNRITGRRID